MADWTLGTDAPTHLVEHNLFDHDGIATPAAGKILGESGGKYTQIDAPTTTDPAAIHDDQASEISALTEKTTPVSGDLLIIEDSAASYVKKRLQVGNLPSSGGGGGLTVTRLVGNTTLTASGIYVVDSAAAIRTITLPALSAAPADGFRIIVKRLGANYVDVDAAGSDEIEPGGGVTSKRLFTNWSAIHLVADDAAVVWYELGYYGAIT